MNKFKREQFIRLLDIKIEVLEKRLQDSDMNDNPTWKWMQERRIEDVKEIKRTFKNMIDNLGDAFEAYEEMRDLIKLQRQALLDCPIVGEVHRDSNDRFKEWNLKYEYILQGEQNEKI